MTRDGLQHLADFLPELERPEFNAGEMRGGHEIAPGIIEMPIASYSKIVAAFIDSAYRHNWVLQDFDWPEWAQSAEAAQLRDDHTAIQHVGVDQLCRLLTVCIRQDRFSEGLLLTAFKSGLILRIVRRAAMLVGDRASGSGE